MRNTRKKGGVRFNLRQRRQQMDTTDGVVLVGPNNNNTSGKKGTSSSRRAVSKRSPKKNNNNLTRARKAIQDHIKLDIEKPNFKSLFAGQLYKFFYRDENGPYQTFKKNKDNFEGKKITIDKFKNHDYNNMIKSLKENIDNLDKDLKHLEESVIKISNIQIPRPIDDELSKLLGLTSITEKTI